MAEQNTTRKLVAILAADVAGYSRLMGEDDQATVQTLNTYRASSKTTSRYTKAVSWIPPGIVC